MARPTRIDLRLLLCSFVGAVLPSLATAAEIIVPPVSERFASEQIEDAPDFQKHVVPLLGRLGCNGRSCHGSFQGRGDLRLSLFGYDFQMDHAALTGEASSQRGSRLNREQPEESLILKKPSVQVDHEGGERFSVGSWEHRMLLRWIESGAHPTTEVREISHLEIEPTEVVFAADAGPVQLRVVAEWSDGSREDVTPLCRFRANDDSVVVVDRDGTVTSAGSGDTHVIAFYDNGVTALPVMRPVLQQQQTLGQEQTSGNEIDRFVLDKLDKLGIVPSEISSETEFLRRASLDLTGTLPAPGEVEAFLADTSADKRLRKINELLQRPAHAAWWANKLCDFTGCNPNQQAELGQETSVQWYMWIYSRLRENVPYDQLVERIVLATSRRRDEPYDEYAAEVSAFFRSESPADFTQQETLPHYWTRRTLDRPEEAALAFAHNFLGIRLQCAQCHKHPFAPWTQHDFEQFGAFFETVKFGVSPEAREPYRALAKQVGLHVKGDNGSAIRQDVLRHARNGRPVPWRELYVAERTEPVSLSLLRSEVVELSGDDDPREPIMQWMRQPDNPWFAAAFVNRVWAGYFHRGLIDPTDDLNPANPPSHPQLLDWLSREFAGHGYDMQWLHRQIVSSKAYQRSWRPNETNRDDRRNYSRAIPRRIPAEVVYDAVKQALAGSDQIDEVRTDLSRRAIGHLSMRLAGTYAMQVFGKPERAVNCDCERVNEPTLLQSVFLQNDPLIDQRLADSGWLEDIVRLESIGDLPERESLVRTAWLRALSRPPTQKEMQRALEHFEQSESTGEGLRDLLWALINTKEFLLH